MSRSRIIAGKAVIVVEVLDNVQKSMAKIQSSMRKVANSAAMAGEQAFRTGFFGSILSGVVIKQFATFSDSMLYLQTKLGIFGKAAGEQKRIMDDLELTIRNLGKSTSFTSTQIAEGAATLAQGGLSYQEVKDTLGALLDLSRASRTEITATAEALVRAMRAFDIPTSTAANVASMFTRATRAGTLELEDLTYALRYSQGTAASLEQSLPVMLALFAEMSNKGMAGSIAGTSMNTAMSQIVKKMEAIQEIFPAFKPIYGPEGFDFPQTLKFLNQLTANMSMFDRKALMQDIFNLRGERAHAASVDIDSVMKLAHEIKNAGSEAHKAAVTMDQGIGGAARIALSAVQELALTLGDIASGPLINILRTVQSLANELSRMAQANPMLAMGILFSPGIFVAAGLGAIAFSKGLFLVATALGVVRSAMRGIAIPMAQGLVSGITQAGAAAGATARGASNISARGSTAIRATNTIRTNKAALSGLQKTYRYEKLLFKMMIQRGVATRQQLAVQGRLALRAKQAVDFNLRSTRLAQGARAVALGKGSTLTGFLKGVASLRRFIPSWWTIIDILILFGDKIPVVSTVLATFGKAFGAAFGEIGKVWAYVQGPFEMIKAGVEAISAGHVSLGIRAIVSAVKGMASIVGNQLIAAWERFKAVLGSIWSMIRGIAVSIWVVFGSVIESVRSQLDSMIGTAGNTFGAMFGTGEGDWTQALILAFNSTAEALMKFLNSLPYIWAMAIEHMSAALDIFVNKFESIAWSIVGALTGADTSGTTAALDSKNVMREKERNAKLRDLDKKWAESSKKITAAFANTAAASNALANEQNRQSQDINQHGYMWANEIRNYIDFLRRNAVQEIQQYQEQAMPSAFPGVQEQASLSSMIAGALVGSADDIRRNIVKYGKTTDEQQLEVMKNIRDNQERQMRQSPDGVVMPMTP